MRTFACPHCSETTNIFRHVGGEQMCRELGVPFLGALPLDADVVTCGDEGRPIVADQPTSASATVYAATNMALVEQFQAAGDGHSAQALCVEVGGSGTATRGRPIGPQQGAAEPKDCISACSGASLGGL